MTDTIKNYFSQLKLPDPYSHKGQNGKLLIIGGSQLFHSASKWSLDVASKFVDMVFYSSVPGNNEMIQAAKKDFWNGIVIPRENVESYLTEADCILIGPGMERSEPALLKMNADQLKERLSQPLTQEDWNGNTEFIINYLLHQYPAKKWVIDAGALQMVLPDLLTPSTIVTPHPGELERLESMMTKRAVFIKSTQGQSAFDQLLATGATIVLKGPKDFIYQGKNVIEIEGGNAGMTKGGTGDTLAGLIAGLYCTNTAEIAAAIGSFCNKQAGEVLAEKVGTFFNTSDLVQVLPEVVWGEYKAATA